LEYGLTRDSETLGQRLLRDALAGHIPTIADGVDDGAVGLFGQIGRCIERGNIGHEAAIEYCILYTEYLEACPKASEINDLLRPPCQK
jgi:hypothetical protein